MRAIRFHQPGDTGVLQLDEIPEPVPGPEEVRIRAQAAGVNFIDIYIRSGFYPSPSLPAIAGKEGAGVVDAVGAEVRGVSVGDRVGYFDAPGSYAEQVVSKADRVIPVPDGISSQVAAAVLLQGMTAHYLTHGIRPLAPGDRVLIHAVAGGVGLLAAQMAKVAGAEVIGTCSTEEKRQRALAAGADHVILYSREDFVEATLALTDGEGVDLAIDGVGRATFEGSVRATRVRGHIILFGQASGEPDPIRPRRLLGSRTLTCASLFDYARQREEMLERADDVFRWLEEGRLEAHIHQVLPLGEARQAQDLLSSRATSGKVLLEP